MKLLFSFCFLAVTAAHLPYYFMKMSHPPFLKNVSLEARLDYYKIFVNKTLTIAEQKEEIKAWAKKNNLTSEVTTFLSEIDKGVVEMKQKVAKLVDASPEAVENFTKIMENENQTMSQMMKAIKKLRTEHPSVFNVYDSAMKEVMGKNGPHGSHVKPQELRFPLPKRQPLHRVRRQMGLENSRSIWGFK
uniref:ANIS5_cation-bd domain-containing protein n=1 Tax=Haemonchus contortus TaxID=6289 RepID=A0A7I4YH20_HAECO